MLEVTGGSAATTASAADADFPALYKVRMLLWYQLFRLPCPHQRQGQYQGARVLI